MTALKYLLALLLVGLVKADESALASGNEENYEEKSTRGISRPSCFVKNNAASCCLGVSIKGSNHNLCIELALRLNQMKAEASLRFDNHVLVSKDASAGKMCAPLPPPLAMFMGCLQIYHADVNVRNKYANVCFVVDLKPLFQVRFDCFRFRDGKFDHHSENPPEKHGLVNIGFQNGKPSFKVHLPGWIGKVVG